MSEACVSYTLPKDQVEAMLANKFGSSLQPVKEHPKRPSIIDMSRMIGRPDKQEQKQKPIGERHVMKMQPHDLTARRVRELVKEGKSSDDVMLMYNFKNRGYFTQSLRELGCQDLVAGPGKKKVW